MYIPIPFYNSNTRVSSGLWRVIMTKETTDIKNVIGLFFPSQDLQIGSIYHFQNTEITIIDIQYDTLGELVLDLHIVSGDTSVSFNFSNLILIGLAGSGAIRQVIKLEDNLIFIVLFYGLILFVLYELLKK